MAENTKTSSPSFATNALYSVFTWGGPLIVSFIATPHIIRGLGVASYGYYSLVLAIIGFGFTTGIGKVTAKYIPECRAGRKGDNLSQLLTASLTITIFAAVVQGAALAIGSTTIVTDILNAPSTSRSELNSAIYVACLIGPVTMVSQFFQSSAQGLNLFKPSALITNLAALALNSGSIILAINGSSYTTIFQWNLFVTALATAALFLYVRPRLPELHLTFNADSKAFRRVGRFAFSIFIYQTITSVLFVFERAYVLRNFGSEMLTYYVVPLMLGIYLHALVASFSQAAVPAINERLDQREKLASFYQLSSKLALAASTLIASGYFVVGQQFLSLWLGEDFAAHSYHLLIIHGTAFCLIAMSIVSWTLAEASHRSGINALSSSVTSVLGITTILLFSGQYGPEGSAAGRLIGAVAVFPLIPYLERKVFGHAFAFFWIGAIFRISVSIIAATVVTSICSYYLPVNWPTFLLLSVVHVVVFLGGVVASGYLRFGELRNFETRINN